MGIFYSYIIRFNSYALRCQKSFKFFDYLGIFHMGSSPILITLITLTYLYFYQRGLIVSTPIW
nr:MAG TPA: protein of unknown function (DUF4719) [Caudoviricetes sp.]